MANRDGGTAAEVFDYVIVGAGAAGCILANRLSEDAGATVCLLESGPRDWHPFLHIPAGFIKVLFNPAFTWQFSTEPGENTKGRRIPVPVGRTLGGSTAINGLVYNRGLPSDYDAWAAAGNRGWSFAEALPYFKRTERKIGVGDDRFHGRQGEMPITDMDWIHPICEAFIAGAQTGDSAQPGLQWRPPGRRRLLPAQHPARLAADHGAHVSAAGAPAPQSRSAYSGYRHVGGLRRQTRGRCALRAQQCARQ
jgi:choline dehydrogenase-like flavoprotein